MSLYQSLQLNSTGDQSLNEISNGGGVQSALTVGTTAVELKVGGSALANRRNCTLYNNSSSPVYWGYTSAVTTTTGTPIAATQFMAWDVGPNTSVFVISAIASRDTRITECAR